MGLNSETYLIICTHKMSTWNILDDNRLSLLHHIPTSPSSTFTQTTPSTLHVAQMAVSASNSSSIVQQGSSRLSGNLNLLI